MGWSARTGTSSCVHSPATCQAPNLSWRGGPGASVYRRFARPFHLPPMTSRWPDQRLRMMRKIKASPEVNYQQPIVLRRSQIAKHKTVVAQHCAIDGPGTTSAEYGITSAQSQQIGVKPENFRMPALLTWIEAGLRRKY